MDLELILFDADRTLFDYDRAENDALRDTFSRELEKGKITTCQLRIERFRRLFDGQMSDTDLAEFSRLYLINLSKGAVYLMELKKSADILRIDIALP